MRSKESELKKMMKKRDRQLKLKDTQVNKNLKWHILRLLRIESATKQELIEKIDKMYLGYWQVNEALIEENLTDLTNDESITCAEVCQITPKGADALHQKENAIREHLQKRASKEACAKFSMWGNVGLSALEFAIGFLSGSIGLIADAVHTGIDIIASAITWIGIKIDKEAQAALIGGIILCGIGAFIAYESVTKILTPAVIDFQIIAIITIVINIGVNGYFSAYKFYVGGRTKSISLIADAYHTKTDIWSSVAVLVGLLGATVGFPVLDAIAGTVVSFFIILGGYELIKESHGVMHGEDPRIEKFSKFLKEHLKVLPDRGLLASLWVLNLKEMEKTENLNRIKKGFGMHFPVRLEDKDYEAVYVKIENDQLAESIESGKLRLSKKGKQELNRLAHNWAQKRYLAMNKINWMAEGL